MRNKVSTAVIRILVILITMLFASMMYARVREGVLHSFSRVKDGNYPEGGVLSDLERSLTRTRDA